MMASHNLMAKQDSSNAGISLDTQYLCQAEHLMRTTNYQYAIKYTVKALEFNPDSKVSNTVCFFFCLFSLPD